MQPSVSMIAATERHRPMWKTAEGFVRLLLDNAAALAFVVGVALFVLGAAGGIKYNNWLPITDELGRGVAIVGGLALVAWGAFQSSGRTSSLPKAADYGIKITHPRPGDRVDTVRVEGTFSKPLPAGYSLRVFRIYTHNHDFV